MSKIHKKLQSVRVALQNSNLQKTGFNAYSKIRYFELGDFLPTAQKLMLDAGISSGDVITRETATLTIFDFDSEESIVFSCPVDAAEISGGKTPKVQLMGATITYYRRYLWMMALEIVEMDEVDRRAYLENTTEKPAYTIEQASANMEAWRNAKAQPQSLIAKISQKFTVPADVAAFITDNLTV